MTQFPVLQFSSWFANQLFTHFGSAQSILNYSERCKLAIRSLLEQCDYLFFFFFLQFNFNPLYAVNKLFLSQNCSDCSMLLSLSSIVLECKH